LVYWDQGSCLAAGKNFVSINSHLPTRREFLHESYGNKLIPAPSTVTRRFGSWSRYKEELLSQCQDARLL
jgi:hypothetical protein